MKVVFVCWGQQNIGVEYISAALMQKGFETDLVFDPALFSSFIFNNKILAKVFDRTKEIIKEVLNKQPDCIAFSVGSDTYLWALTLAKAIKGLDKDIPIVFGGIHPTLLPDKVIREECVDYVCVGEGEEAMCDLVYALQNNLSTIDILNIWAKKDKVYENKVRPFTQVDLLPHPDKNLFNRNWKGFTEDIYWVMSSRGCIYNCSFCCHGSLKEVYGCKENFRERNIEDVIAELKEAKAKYNIKKICFVDDLFIFDKQRAIRFLELYRKEIDLPFAAEIHPQFVDAEIAELLAKSGCKTLGIGVQTISEKIRHEVLNRPGSNAKLIECIKFFKDTDIFIFAEIIVGLPLQDEKEIFDIIYFFKENPVDFVLPLWLRYYPKTAIVQTAMKQGLLTQRDVAQIEDSKEFKPVSIKGNASTESMSRVYNFLLVSHFLPLRLIRWIERKRLYRKMPAVTFTLLRVISVLNDIFKMLIKRKKRFMYLSFLGNIRFYIHFMFFAKK